MTTQTAIMSTTSTAIDDTSLEAETSRLESHGYLFGQHITHSWSPFLHDVIYQDLGLDWGQVRLDSADIPLFLKLTQHPQFYGASVTMPNKVAIIPHLDELTDECRDIGACNTVFLRTITDDTTGSTRRILCGTNTDVIGIRDSFIYNVPSPATTYHSKPALVIGGGGAARSAVYALRRWLQVTTIYLVNRDAEEVTSVIRDCAARGYGEDLLHVATLDQATSLPAPGAIVACVPDFAPQTPEELQARAITDDFLERGHGGAMLEMCYNPTPFTQLAAIAEDKGWQVILGTEALIWQGLEQDRYWTGKTVEELPVKKVQQAIAEKVAQRSQSKL